MPDISSTLAARHHETSRLQSVFDQWRSTPYLSIGATAATADELDTVSAAHPQDGLQALNSSSRQGSPDEANLQTVAHQATYEPTSHDSSADGHLAYAICEQHQSLCKPLEAPAVMPDAARAELQYDAAAAATALVTASEASVPRPVVDPEGTAATSTSAADQAPTAAAKGDVASEPAAQPEHLGDEPDGTAVMIAADTEDTVSGAKAAADARPADEAAHEEAASQFAARRSLQPAAPLDRSTSEPALLTRQQSDLLFIPPIKPQRKSLMSRLRRTKEAPDSVLGRTASDTSVLARSTSGDQSQGSPTPPKRRSLLGLLKRGSSGRAASTAGAAMTDAQSLAGKQPVVSPAESQEESVVTRRSPSLHLDDHVAQPEPFSIPLAAAVPEQAISSEELVSQSAPASPRGRARAPPVLVPQGSLGQAEMAVGRAASDPNMLSHRPSGMHSNPTTPRRMSLLGRLSRVRRSNSIVPEPSIAEEAGQMELPQPEQQGFAEQPMNEVPFAEQLFGNEPTEEAQPALQDLPSGNKGLPIEFEALPIGDEALPAADPNAVAQAPSADEPPVEQFAAGTSPANKLGASQLSQGGQDADLALAEEAAQEQPLAEEAAQGQPLAEKAAQEQPLAEKAAQEQPLAEEAAQEQPLAEEAAQEQPLAEEAAQEQPLAEEAAREQPLAEEAAREQPLAEEAAREQLLAEEAAQEQPLAEEAAQEQLLAEEAAREQPSAEEAAQEQPLAEQPLNDQSGGSVGEVAAMDNSDVGQGYEHSAPELAAAPVEPAAAPSEPVACPASDALGPVAAARAADAAPAAATAAEAVPDFETAAQPEEVTQPEVATEPDTVSQSETVAEPAAVPQPASAAENEPIAEVKAASQPEPALGTEPSTEPEAASAPEAAPEPSSELTPAAKPQQENEAAPNAETNLPPSSEAEPLPGRAPSNASSSPVPESDPAQAADVAPEKAAEAAQAAAPQTAQAGAETPPASEQPAAAPEPLPVADTAGPPATAERLESDRAQPPAAASGPPAVGSGLSKAAPGPPVQASRPSSAGALPSAAPRPSAAAPRPSSAGPGPRPSSAKKGKKGKAPDRLSAILQRIADDTAPVLPNESGGLGQLPRMSGTSLSSHSDEVASLHSKMDQLIAAYALASTPRGTYIPESIFAPTPDTGSQAMDISPTSAASIAPKHRLSAHDSPVAVSSEDNAAQGRATAGPALSPAPGKAVPGSALRLAPLQIPSGAPSAVQAPPAKVRRSVSFAAPAGSPGDDSPQDDESPSSTAKNADAVSEETGPALHNRGASLQPALRSSTGTSADATSGTNAEAADQQALPLPGASAKPRRSFKQFFKRALH
ncbi:MAG: hypothetical protein FRX49_11538 [Trebouxia sp. A1-2]|nr:MAG: hypothetical protein FRX49_11538 [Trebouxia sp. A1-2]